MTDDIDPRRPEPLVGPPRPVGEPGPPQAGSGPTQEPALLRDDRTGAALAPPGDEAATPNLPDRSGRGVPPGVRFRSLVEVLLCSGFPTQLALAGLLAVGGLLPFLPDGRLSGRYVFTLSLLDAAILTGLVFWLLRLGGERPLEVLFGRRRIGREALLGVGLIPAVFLLAVGMLALIHALAPSLRNVPRNPLEALLQSPLDAVIFGAVTVLSGGIREELQRAFILHRFDQHLGGGWLGLLLFSLVFGVGHLIQGWDVAITTASLGAFWGAVFLVRGSATAAIVSHAGFDVLQVFQYTLHGS